MGQRLRQELGGGAKVPGEIDAAHLPAALDQDELRTLPSCRRPDILPSSR